MPNPYLVTFIGREGLALGWHNTGIRENTPEAVKAFVSDPENNVPRGTTHVLVSDRLQDYARTRVMSLTLYKIDTREVVTTETTVQRGA